MQAASLCICVAASHDIHHCVFTPITSGLQVMGQHKKPDVRSAGADHRDALEKIARLLSVAEEHVPPPGASDERHDISPVQSREQAHTQGAPRQPGVTQLLEALPAGLAICAGGSLIKANSAFAQAFGYASASELEEAGGLRAIFPSEEKALAEHFDKARGAADKAIEYLARSSSGREFRMPVAIHPIAMEDGERTSLLALHPPPPDTSCPDDGPDFGSELTDFLAKVSHEVRTPLNSIIGFAEIMIQEQLGALGNARYREYIRHIFESGHYALSLVNDLLDISKIKAGKFELNFTAVDLEDVVSESVHSMQPQAQRQRVLLRTSFADTPARVLADRRSIKQIILNLVSNAIKFTNPGGQVIVSTQSTASGGVRIRVCDNGIGMSRHEIAIAVKPFQQLDTAPRKQAGTGLGLPLTKALVEANRAQFELSSVSGSGTRAEIIFPQDRAAGAKE